MMTEVEAKTHVFLKPCGCLACVVVNVPRMFGELAKAQRYAKRHQETYKLMGTEEVREMEWECPQHRKGEDHDKD